MKTETGSPSGREPQRPDPDAEFCRALTDDEVRELGYTHRDADGRWIRPPLERKPRRIPEPPHVTNDNAMRDALVDAFGDRPMVGALRGKKSVTPLRTFDWGEVRRRVDEEHAQEIERVENPRRSQQRREERPRFSVVSADELMAGTARHGNRERSYGWKILVDECHRVADTPSGNRNNTLVSAAFKVGRGAVGPGFLGRDECYANLLGAALDSGLPEIEARQTIRTGLSAGAQKPRPLRPVNKRPAS